MRNRCRTPLALSLSLLALALVPACTPGPAESGASVEEPGYLETVLPNGMRVVLMERLAVPMISATAIVGAGSALESEDFSGASHFLEHLLFNGTSTMTQEELYDAVERIGGYNNAHTDEDHTYYTMLVPSEHARTGLEVQAAMLFDSTLPGEKFDKERKIVLEEIAKDRSRPGYELDLAVRRALSPATPYGRPVIGTYESLEGIGLDRVRAYYERQYVPDNIVLLVMGQFESREMLSLVEEIYGAPPRGGEVPPVPDPFEGAPAGTLSRVTVPGETTVVSLALPAPGPCEEGGREAAVLARLLGAESGPLRRVLGPEQATRLSVSYLPRPVGSALVAEAELAEGAPAGDVLGRMLESLEGAGRYGLSQPGFEAVEVARVARAARTGELLMGQRIHYFGMLRADILAGCGGELRPLLAPGAERPVSPEDVARVAGELLTEVAARAVAVVAGPEAGEGAEPLPVPTPQEPPAPAAVSEVPGADLDRTLENGLRVLVSRERDAEITGIHLLVRDRSAREPRGRAGLADLLHRSLPLGTALSDRAALAARLERLGAELKEADSDFIPYDDYYTSPSHSFLRMEVPSENWLAALDLLAELVRAPAFAEEEFEPLLQARIRRAAKQESDPSEQGSRAYAAALLGADHPLVSPVGGWPASLRGLTHRELKAFSRDYLAPGGMILSLVGPQDPDDVLGAVGERFAGGRPVSASSPPPWPTTDRPGEPVVREVGADQARIYLGRISPLPAERRAGLRLLASLLSDRLARTLREEQGLAYRLGATAQISAAPDQGWLTVWIGTRPDNIEVARAGLIEQMERLRNEMAGQEEIDRVRAERRGRALMRRMTAINRARYLGLWAFTGHPAAEDLETLDAVDGVSREELANLAEEWLRPEAYRVVIVR